MSRESRSVEGGLSRRETLAGAAALGLVAGSAQAQDSAEATGIVYAVSASGPDRSPLAGSWSPTARRSPAPTAPAATGCRCRGTARSS